MERQNMVRMQPGQWGSCKDGKMKYDGCQILDPGYWIALNY